MRTRRGRLGLKDYQKIKDYNELDLVMKMRSVLAESQTFAEKILHGNKTAMLELRKYMNDNINLSFVLRDMIRMKTGDLDRNKALENVIETEQKAYDDVFDNRKGKLEAEAMLEKIIQVRLAEKKRREEREQKKQEERSRTSGGEHQEAPDKL